MSIYAIQNPESICLPSPLKGKTVEEAVADAQDRGLKGYVILLNPPINPVYAGSHINAHITAPLRFAGSPVYAVVE